MASPVVVRKNGNGNGRHVLSAEEASRGGRAGAAARRTLNQLSKKALKMEGVKISADTFKTAMTQPVLVGLLGYGIVNSFPDFFVGKNPNTVRPSTSTTSAGAVGPQSQPQQTNWVEWIQNLFTNTSSTPGVFLPGSPLAGNPIGQWITNVSNQAKSDVVGVVDQAEIAALKGALIIYIASGGNLAGVLSAASGPLTTVLSGLLAGGA